MSNLNDRYCALDYNNQASASVTPPHIYQCRISSYTASSSAIHFPIETPYPVQLQYLLEEPDFYQLLFRLNCESLRPHRWYKFASISRRVWLLLLAGIGLLISFSTNVVANFICCLLFGLLTGFELYHNTLLYFDNKKRNRILNALRQDCFPFLELDLVAQHAEENRTACRFYHLNCDVDQLVLTVRL
jgi:hypothetical protein